eukprot:UC1_evm1s2092
MLRTTVLFGLLAAVAFSAEVEKDGEVFIGTDDNFADFIKENPNVLAEFYAPWCGHCKQLAPEYEAAAKTLKENGVPVALIKIDATEQENIAQEYEVQGYPTLKWFVDGTASEYNGGRTADDIVAFATKKTGPPTSVLADTEAFEAFLKDNEVAVLLLGKAEGATFEAFEQSAKTSEYLYATTELAEASEKLGASAPAIVVSRDFADPAVFEGEEITAEAIDAFVSTVSLPDVLNFNEKNAPKIFGGDLKVHFLLFTKHSDEEAHVPLAEAFAAAAKTFKGKLLFVTVDVEVEEHASIMEFFKLESSPSYRIVDMSSGMNKYKPASEEVTAENIVAYAQDFIDGNLKRDLMVEDLPEDWDAKPCKVLTGHNFAEVALNDDTHAFVEFYAPWCGHCKQLAPIWDRLAEKYDSNDKITVAKMDSTANEVEGIDVESFPTIMYFAPGAND